MNTELRVAAGMTVSYASFNDIARVRSALAADERESAGKSGGDAIASAARALDTQLAALATGPRGGGFGPANRDLARHLEDLDLGDLEPTASDLAAIEANCREVDEASASLAALQSSISSLDAMLRGAHMTALPSLHAAPAPACQERATR